MAGYMAGVRRLSNLPSCGRRPFLRHVSDFTAHSLYSLLVCSRVQRGLVAHLGQTVHGGGPRVYQPHGVHALHLPGREHAQTERVGTFNAAFQKGQRYLDDTNIGAERSGIVRHLGDSGGSLQLRHRAHVPDGIIW